MSALELNYLPTYLPNYLTTWSRVLLEELTVCSTRKKFTNFYGTQRFITVFTRGHHQSLS
jgi:hypothetical protein